MSANFDWIPFYEELADKLLEFKDRKKELFEIIKSIVPQNEKLDYLHFDRDEYWDYRNYEIDPFSVFAMFTRQSTQENRLTIANIIAKTFDLKTPIFTSFDGIPVMSSRNSIFSGNDEVWNLFELALNYSTNDNFTSEFNSFFSKAIDAKGNGLATITMGLFWIRPNIFLNLDSQNREFLANPANNMQNVIDVFPDLLKGKVPTGQQYLEICAKCKENIQSSGKYKNFADMSNQAWKSEETTEKQSSASFLKWFKPLIVALKDLGGSGTPEQVRLKISENEKLDDDVVNETRGKNNFKKFDNEVAWARNYLVYEGLISNEKRGVWTLTNAGHNIIMTDKLASDIFVKWINMMKNKEPSTKTNEIYTKQDFLAEVFIDETNYDTLVDLLKHKKNIILQGAPGVGKTFVAKRLAYSIMNEKDESRVEFVQFHQSYSYEDFIMGYRPCEEGFKLNYGVFYEFCKKATLDTDNEYFFIIDEINRGNLSKIFGELFMLIEHDKRGESNSLKLMYSSENFYVPENVHIIGMMNTADRGLAMLDYALRRRFAFYEMQPAFDTVSFNNYLESVQNTRLNSLVSAIKSLNNEIMEDMSLGRGFRVGHSYLVENDINVIDDKFISNIITYEILPLITEYWFDEQNKIDSWTNRLRGI